MHLATAIGALFLVLFEVDLHCTQTASFRIATLAMEPHPEEGIDGNSVAAIYGQSAIPAAYLLWIYVVPVPVRAAAARIASCEHKRVSARGSSSRSRPPC